MLTSRMLVRVTQNIRTHHSAGEAVPSPHPTASLRSAGALLIQDTLAQQVAASWTSFEADCYDRYISQGMCTPNGRNLVTIGRSPGAIAPRVCRASEQRARF